LHCNIVAGSDAGTNGGAYHSEGVNVKEAFCRTAVLFQNHILVFRVVLYFVTVLSLLVAGQCFRLEDVWSRCRAGAWDACTIVDLLKDDARKDKRRRKSPGGMKQRVVWVLR